MRDYRVRTFGITGTMLVLFHEINMNYYWNRNILISRY